MLKQWLEKYIVKWAVQQFTLENLQAILVRCVAYLRVKAAESETAIDDWGIEILDGIVNDTDKLKVLYQWLYSFIAGNVCTANPSLDQEKELIQDLILAGGTDGKNCKAISPAVYEAVLNMILPILIEFWRQNKK